MKENSVRFRENVTMIKKTLCAHSLGTQCRDTIALEMLRKLHLLASIEQPQLHKLVTDLQSKLTDIYLDSIATKQSSITDYFK